MNGTTKQIKLKEALHIPELRANLLLVGKICDKGYKVIFESDAATIMNAKGRPILKAERWFLITENCEAIARTARDSEVTKKSQNAEVRHRKIGHLNYCDLWKCKQNKAVFELIFKDVQMMHHVTSVPGKNDSNFLSEEIREKDRSIRDCPFGCLRSIPDGVKRRI